MIMFMNALSPSGKLVVKSMFMALAVWTCFPLTNSYVSTAYFLVDSAAVAFMLTLPLGTCTGPVLHSVPFTMKLSLPIAG